MIELLNISDRKSLTGCITSLATSIEAAALDGVDESRGASISSVEVKGNWDNRGRFLADPNSTRKAQKTESSKERESAKTQWLISSNDLEIDLTALWEMYDYLMNYEDDTYCVCLYYYLDLMTTVVLSGNS